MKYILVFLVLKIAHAATVLYSGKVEGDMVSMNADGSAIAVMTIYAQHSLNIFKRSNSGYDPIKIMNANVWFPNTTYSDVTRFEYLKKFRPQFHRNGTMYYMIGNSGYVVAADLSPVTKDNPYMDVVYINNYVCTTGYRCIFNVDNDIITFYNPDTRYTTALNSQGIQYNSINTTNVNIARTFENTLSISHTLNQNGFVVTVFDYGNSWWNYYWAYYSGAAVYFYRSAYES